MKNECEVARKRTSVENAEFKNAKKQQQNRISKGLGVAIDSLQVISKQFKFNLYILMQAITPFITPSFHPTISCFLIDTWDEDFYWELDRTFLIQLFLFLPS